MSNGKRWNGWEMGDEWFLAAVQLRMSHMSYLTIEFPGNL
jgi:hypothetical protein